MSRLSKHGMCLLNCKRIKQARMAFNSTLVFYKFYAMVILRVCTIYFFSHLPLRDFFSTPPITFLMVRPSVLRVKSWLLAPLLGRSHVLLNHHSMAPVYRHFVKCTALRGLRAVKSELNPGYVLGFQLTDT